MNQWSTSSLQHNRMHKAFLSIIHGQYYQNPLKAQLKEHLPDHLHQLIFTIFYHIDQAVLSIKTCPVTTLKLCKKFISKYRYIWVYIRFSCTLLKVGRILIDQQFYLSFLTSFLKTGLTSTYFSAEGKGQLDNALLKVMIYEKSYNIFIFFDYFNGYFNHLKSFLGI